MTYSKVIDRVEPPTSRRRDGTGTGNIDPKSLKEAVWLWTKKVWTGSDGPKTYLIHKNDPMWQKSDEILGIILWKCHEIVTRYGTKVDHYQG